MSALLGPNDPPIFSLLNEHSDSPVLFVSDHNGNKVPEKLNNLGLSPEQLDRHIGWDIGISLISEILSDRFQATAIRQTYSRLVVDCNRLPGSDGAMPEISDGISIPGNLSMSEDGRAARMNEIFWPYHNRVDELLTGIRARGQKPVLVSLHSFTPMMQGGELRPWEMGFLWIRDERLSRRMIDILNRPGYYTIGENQPYSGVDPQGYATKVHGEENDVPYLAVEIRQDLIADEAGGAKWAGIFGDALEEAVNSLQNSREIARGAA